MNKLNKTLMHNFYKTSAYMNIELESKYQVDTPIPFEKLQES